MGFVYEWINNINQKWYVGSHKGETSSRYIGSGRAFKAAVKKYGIENFTRRILYEGDDFKNQETLILNERDAESDPQSYNLRNNARGGFGTLKGRTFEDIYGEEEAKNQKERRTKTLTGHEVSKESIKKISDSVSKTFKELKLKPSKKAIDRSASRRKLRKNFKDTKNELTVKVLKREVWCKGKKVGPNAANKAWATKRAKLLEDPNYTLNTSKGKSWDELHGKEKAEKLRISQSLNKKGKTSKKKGKSYEEQYGDERSKEIKENLSLARKGKIVVEGKLVNRGKNDSNLQ